MGAKNLMGSDPIRSFWSFQGSPHRLALAFGLGVALGILPGTGALAAAVCAALLRLNLPLMMAGALLTNPATALLIYPVSFLLGKWLLGERLPTDFLAQIAVGTITGNLILAIVLGAVGYGVALGSIRIFRARYAAGH